MCRITLNIDRDGHICYMWTLHCLPVTDKWPTMPTDWTPREVRGNFTWSPMEGCEGLEIIAPVIVGHPDDLNQVDLDNGSDGGREPSWFGKHPGTSHVMMAMAQVLIPVL